MKKCGQKIGVPWPWGRFFAIFGVQPGAQNRQKTSPGAKKCLRRRCRKRFLSFFLAGAVQSRSPNRFLKGLTLENCAPTTAGARFSENHRFQKNTENIPSRDLFCDPKSTKIDAERTENHQNCQKRQFLELPKIMRFFACEKNAKKTRKKVKRWVARRNARGQRGGKEGCITLQKSACGGEIRRRVLQRSLCRVMAGV